MFAELRSKSRITIPKELVDKLGLIEGDKLGIFEREGTICIMPVVVYLKETLDEFRMEIEETRAKIASGEQPVFNTIDALFEELENS